MIDLEVLNTENAPDAASADLEHVRSKYKFVPNLMGVMANAPPTLRAYLSLGDLFDQTSLSPLERQIVLLATSVANACDYCVAAHSAAAQMQKVPPDVVTAIREGQPLSVPRWEALRSLAEEIVNSRGWPDEEIVAEFLGVGYSATQVLEVILGVAMKTLSNYTNHMAATPLDPQFASGSWSSPAASTD